MKKIYLIALLIIIFAFQKVEWGVYNYTSSHYSESIEMKENNTFIYKLNLNNSQYKAEGNYHFLKDSIILNSHLQKDRIIVFETNSGKQNITFEVKTKDDRYFTYHLHLLNNGKEFVAKDQWEKSRFINLKIKGFYIVDTNGLKSPKYMLKGTATNHFKVLFESSRIFENESWIIKNNKIIPRGFDGQFQQYSLDQLK